MAAAARYARALVDVVLRAPDPAVAAAIEKELQDFLDLTRASADLRNILASPAVSAPKKRALIEKLGARIALSKTARNFLFVLVDHRRMGQLGEALLLFRALIDERLGMVEAQISSAQPMNDAEKSALEAALSKKTGRKVRAAYAVDAALIGGAVTRIGSTIYDGSVREHLRVLRVRLSS